MRPLIQLVLCSIFCYFYFPALFVRSQMTLPSMVTIPPDSAPATMNTSSTYAMTIYDQACLDQAEPSSASNESSSGNSSSSSSGDDDLSQWVQSQFVVYVGAVALNSNNTCQVVCQVQSLMSFAIMFGQDIRTRSVLIGRVYLSSMPDGTSCMDSESNNGTCSSGICGSGSGNETTTQSSGSSTVVGGSTTLSSSSSGTTVSGASVATTASAGSSTTAAATTAAPSG